MTGDKIYISQEEEEPGEAEEDSELDEGLDEGDEWDEEVE